MTQSCPPAKEIPVPDLQNEQLVDCDLTGVSILFGDGRRMAIPPAGEAVSGMPEHMPGSENLDKISVANLGPGLGVVAFAENEAHLVSYWGPAEATAIVKERQARAK